MVRDVRFRVHQEVAWNEDNAFIGAATGRGRQFRSRAGRNVYADDREVTGFKLKNVRAVLERNRLRAVSVRVRADSAPKYDLRIHSCPTIGEPREKRKNKIPAIAGVTVMCESATLPNCGNSISRTPKSAWPGDSPLPEEGENDPGASR